MIIHGIRALKTPWVVTHSFGRLTSSLASCFLPVEINSEKERKNSNQILLANSQIYPTSVFTLYDYCYSAHNRNNHIVTINST